MLTLTDFRLLGGRERRRQALEHHVQAHVEPADGHHHLPRA